jgi:putative redox protein
MSEHRIICNWDKNMQFEAHDLQEHKVRMDIGKENGGDGAGFSPMPLVLVSLSGCMGVDVKLTLDKMRIDIEKLELEVIGELDEDKKPRTYKKITINFFFYGKNLKISKLERAIKISETTLCNVSAMLSQICELEYNAIAVEVE